MAQGALQPALVDGGRVRRLRDGSYVDTASGKRYASYKDIPQAKAQLGDPAAMRASIKSNMGPSTGVYDTSGAPNVLDAFHGNTDILGALGATPVTDPNDQIPMAGAMAARNPQPPRPAAAGPPGVATPQGSLAAAAPPAPLAASGALQIPMAGATVARNPQAAHPPGPGGGLAPTPDQEQAPVIQGGGPDLLTPSLSSGVGALKGATAPKIPNAVDNTASLGALGNGLQPKPLDVTSGLAAMSQKTAPELLTHDPSWMEKVGGALGLRTPGPSTSGGGAFDGLFDDPDRRRLLEMGLGTMAAAGQPGATVGGALGQGGLGAIHSEDIRKEREDKTKEAQIRLDTESARYDADRRERAAFHGDENKHWNDTNTREIARDNATAATAAAQLAREDVRDRNTADYQTREADTASRNATTAASNASSTEANRVSEEEDRKSKRFNAAFVRAQGKSVNPLTGLLQLDDPSKAPPTTAEARRAAAMEVPDAPESKQYASDQLGKYQQALALAKTKGDKAAMSQAQQGIDLITSKFNLKPRK